MIVRRVFPGPGDAIDIAADDSRSRLAELYALDAPRWLRVNLVADAAGSAAGWDGTSEPLSNRVDRAILGVIRRSGDVVLVGAESVRAEGYQLPRTVPLAVVTSSGDLSGHRIASPGSLPPRLRVLCPASAVERVRDTAVDAQIVVVPDVAGRLAPADIVAALRARGGDRIVCEGGPGLAGQLVAAGLVDELCLTTSPSVGGPSLPLLGERVETARPLELGQLLVDDFGAVYARWRLIGRAEAGAASR